MSRIIVTRGVSEYRQTIPHYITKQDIVIEIGCASGTTTADLYKHALHVVGIDKGKALSVAREKYPHIQFEKIDGFDISKVRQLGYEFTKIYIDISGSRDIHDVIRMVTKYDVVFRPEIIVVKSTKLKHLVSKCVFWNS